MQEGVLCDQEIQKCNHRLQHMEHKAHHSMQCDWLRVSELHPVGQSRLVGSWTIVKPCSKPSGFYEVC